ncbi:hypothetical protein FBY30_2173 [Arthrobacter sp. SLBN-83]|uniref:hypothetical protein n=1 Tax=Arthrobacter sp. SLBN-83 TaxID=2768449 RepID=UPI001154157A|nr:hypothetical protein [Arthrobacter sp. SLBN-83]TQJ59916.1 hypothetical protein FBY30_2173 [Arthrobacter sp. SLBN-83]
MVKKVVRTLRGSAVAIVSMLPGFAFPFITSAVIGQAKSDPFFLAVSVALVLSNVFGNTVEMHSVVQIGRITSTGGTIYRTQIKRYRQKVRKFTLLSIGLCGPVLVGLYAARATQETAYQFAGIAAIALLVPIIGGEASTRSGQLIAQGRHEIAIMLQAMRSLFPLVFVLLVPGAPLWSLASVMVAGECTRLILVAVAVPRPDVRGGGSPLMLDSRGLSQQSLSTATMQAAPIADRLFLSGAPVGSITSYELADKVFFAGVQFLNLSHLIGRMKAWVGLREVSVLQATAALRRDLIVLVAASAGAGVLAIAGLFLVSTLSIVPLAWREGLGWAQILLLSLPGTLVSMACSRLLIVADRQKVLLVFSSVVTVTTILSDMLFFTLFGAIGIPVAAAIIRSVTAAIYVGVMWRYLKPTLGSEVPKEGHAGAGGAELDKLAN